MDSNGTFYTKDELLNLGIYELRELGRDVGVISPTTLKKEQLVDEILKIIYGHKPKREVGKGRGRPARTRQKPCKVFVDLIEQIETPVVDTSFIYESHPENKSFDYAYMEKAMVASPKEGYVVDSPDGAPKLTHGVVCIEKDGCYVRKLRFVHSASDVILSKKFIEDYDLRDNDLVDYLPSTTKGEVEQIVKINGNLASRGLASKRKSRKLEVQKLAVADDYYILSNQSNILYVEGKTERAELFECTCRVLEKEGYSLIRVCFDKTMEEGGYDGDPKTTSIYASAIGDEYDTIAMAELAVERTKLYDKTQEKTALVIDNLGWLWSVIDTYPKSLYGNFLYRLGQLPSSPSANITVVCLTSHLTESKARDLSGFFDNIVAKK